MATSATSTASAPSRARLPDYARTRRISKPGVSMKRRSVQSQPALIPRARNRRHVFSVQRILRLGNKLPNLLQPRFQLFARSAEVYGGAVRRAICDLGHNGRDRNYSHRKDIAPDQVI